jgi:hypothetical protein
MLLVAEITQHLMVGWLTGKHGKPQPKFQPIFEQGLNTSQAWANLLDDSKGIVWATNMVEQTTKKKLKIQYRP